MSWLWRRRETLNEKLLRQAEYSLSEADAEMDHEAVPEIEPSEPTQPPALRKARPANRPPNPSVVAATVPAPELTRDSYTFTTLPDGSLIVEDSCDEDLSRLADAVEAHIQPPYRAAAVRHQGGLWVVSARPIEVARLTADGEDVVLSSVADIRTYTIDGEPADNALAPAELATLGAACSTDYAARALRIDGDLWEVQIDPV